MATYTQGPKKPISHLSKNDAVKELEEYQAEFDPKWTLVELKELVREYRELDPTALRRDPRLKGLGKKTLNQLRSTASEMKLAFTMKDTRGKLMLTIRRACQNDPVVSTPPGQQVLTFGAHRGHTYQDTLKKYPDYCD